MSVKKYWIWFGAVLGVIAAGIEIYNQWKDSQGVAAPITFKAVKVTGDPTNKKRAIVQTWFWRTNPVCHYTSWSPVITDYRGFRYDDLATTVGKARTVGDTDLLSDTYSVTWGSEIPDGIATYGATISYLCGNKVTVVDYPISSFCIGGKCGKVEVKTNE